MRCEIDLIGLVIGQIQGSGECARSFICGPTIPKERRNDPRSLRKSKLGKRKRGPLLESNKSSN